MPEKKSSSTIGKGDRKAIVDYMFDTFPEQFKGDREHWYEFKGEDDDFMNAWQLVFDKMGPADRKKTIDFLYDNYPDTFTGDREYWYEPRPGEDGLSKTLRATIDDSSGAGGTSAGTEDESPGKTSVGGASDEDFTILRGKDMKWYFDAETGDWIVTYKLPNSDRWLAFTASGEQMDLLFGDGQRPTSYEQISFADLTQQEGITYGGNVFEISGKGSFEGEVDRVIALALDEGVLPKWAQGSGEVYDLLFIAQNEGKSPEWLIEQLSTLDSFKARFPGIEAMQALGLSIVESVEGFLELEAGIKELALRDGDNPDSITPKLVGDLISQGHSLTDVQAVYEIFDRLENNSGALDAFNDVLKANGMDPLSADDQFEFMAGNAPKELYDIWEQSSLHQAAIDAGITGLGVQGAIDLAARTEGLTSYGAAFEGLSVAAANMLRFRTEIKFDQYGINEQDLIDMSLGLAPSSGASQADVGERIERAFQSAKAKRERSRVNPFARFTDQGVPQQASLGGARQESA